MRTLHFHHDWGLHRPDWHIFMSRLMHILFEPFFWAALILAILILAAILLAIYGPSSSQHLPPQYPMYFP